MDTDFLNFYCLEIVLYLKAIEMKNFNFYGFEYKRVILFYKYFIFTELKQNTNLFKFKVRALKWTINKALHFMAFIDC